MRALLGVLIPLSLVLAVADVWQGSPQNMSDYQTTQLVEPVGIAENGEVVSADDPSAVEVVDEMVVPMGPQASQVAIKQLGTNGGGYNGVNSASVLENPTPLSNLLQCVSLLLIPRCLGVFFRPLRERPPPGPCDILLDVCHLLWSPCLLSGISRWRARPSLPKTVRSTWGRRASPGGNMEGKETRFGVTDSALWATFTTAASNGSVNSMHDSFTPMGGMVPMLLMQLGEIIFGGIRMRPVFHDWFCDA